MSDCGLCKSKTASGRGTKADTVRVLDSPPDQDRIQHLGAPPREPVGQKQVQPGGRRPDGPPVGPRARPSGRLAGSRASGPAGQQASRQEQCVQR